MNQLLNKTIVMSIEPSKDLSAMVGHPYYIEKRCSVKELLEKGVIDESDLEQMSSGRQICKTIKVDTSGG